MLLSFRDSAYEESECLVLTRWREEQPDFAPALKRQKPGDEMSRTGDRRAGYGDSLRSNSKGGNSMAKTSKLTTKMAVTRCFGIRKNNE